MGDERTPGGPLTSEGRTLLLSIARTTIEAQVRGDRAPDVEVHAGVLKERRGAFVTLHMHGRLKGCIGYVEAHKPLHETIREMAAAAAFSDPRFPPVTEAEVPELEIEISVLSPLREIRDVEEIEVGVHGILLAQGRRQGLLLPQVATEQGWDREMFLEHTCVKAGLSRNVWRDPRTRIRIFSAEVFGEER